MLLFMSPATTETSTDCHTPSRHAVLPISDSAFTLASVARKIADVRRNARNFSLVVVAESVKTDSGDALPEFGAAGPPLPQYGGIGHYLKNHIAEATGAATRDIGRAASRARVCK